MSYFTANLTEIEEQIRAELAAQDTKWAKAIDRRPVPAASGEGQ
ncbi:hypothetical protein [Planomonospora sp. ID67723]|nr:hypothetical protein [Planomonospora sp. ID67723]